jgi:hypothetical protein
VATDDLPYICSFEVAQRKSVTHRKITKKCRWLEGCSRYIVAMRTHHLIAHGDQFAFAAEVVRYRFSRSDFALEIHRVLNRRACVDFPLRSPAAAIPPEEDAAGVVAMMTLRARFDQDAGRDAGAMLALFDAMIRALTGGEHRH